jgi:A/G-specific adenine glycosylase
VREKTNDFVARLLSWHEVNTARFQWSETKAQYKILLAETLLRKTTREQVSRIFDKLTQRYPTIESLASADAKELEKMIKPLGMQKKRSALLIRLANYIVTKYGGEIPRSVSELKKIPGIGPYSANAILCLAYDENLPLVDTNVIRVIERVFGVKSKKARARTDPNVWLFVENLIPRGKARDFNLAILDFANLVCTAKYPKCQFCFARDICEHVKASSQIKKTERNSV